MKRLIYIPDPGASATAFYKVEAHAVGFYGASGQMIVRVVRHSDNVILEQVSVAVPGAFIDVLVSVAKIQQDVRFYVTISRSTGGSSSTVPSGAVTYPNPGYATTLGVTVTAL